MSSTILSLEFAEAIRERRAFKDANLIAAHTKGGTYVLASSGRWNDSGRPRDLLAILPGNLGQGQVLKLYVGVSPDLVDEVEATLAAPVSDAEAVRLANEGARRAYCPRCERGHEGACER